MKNMGFNLNEVSLKLDMTMPRLRDYKNLQNRGGFGNGFGGKGKGGSQSWDLPDLDEVGLKSNMNMPRLRDYKNCRRTSLWITRATAAAGGTATRRTIGTARLEEGVSYNQYL